MIKRIIKYWTEFKLLYNNLIKHKFDRRFVIFLFFFFISFFLWFIQALNKNYITEISQKVNFTGTYDTIIIQNQKQLPEALTLKVEAKGFDLLNYSLKLSHKKINLLFQNLNFIPKQPGDSIHYYFYTNTLKNVFQSQISNNFKLLEIYPDTLSFNFTRYTYKDVVVNTKIALKYAQGFRLKGNISISPQIVRLYGPDFIVNAIDTIYTQTPQIDELSNDLDIKTRLEIPERTKINTNLVVIKAHIAQFTEFSQKFKPKLINVPDSLRIILFPNEIQTKYQIYIEDISKQKINQLDIIADFKNIKNNQLILKAKVLNPKILNFSFSPTMVKYIVEKKNIDSLKLK